MNELKNDNVEFIIAQTDDRIMRNVQETINVMQLFQKHPDTHLIIINGFMDYSSATNKYITNNKAAANQYWSDKTSEDTIDRMRAAAEKGRYSLSSCPIGFIKNAESKKLSINIEQQPILIEIAKKIASNEYSVNAVLKLLKKDNVLGIKWTYKKLMELLTNKIAIGTFVNKKQGYEVKNHSPHLFTDELWIAIQKALKRRKNLNSHQYLYKNKVKCKKCGEWCTHSCTVRPYRIYRYYVCTTCNQRINEDTITKQVLHILQQGLNEDKKAQLIKSNKKQISKVNFLLKQINKDFVEDLIKKKEYVQQREDLLFKRSCLIGENRDLEQANQLKFSDLDYYARKELIKSSLDFLFINLQCKEIQVVRKESAVYKSKEDE